MQATSPLGGAKIWRLAVSHLAFPTVTLVLLVPLLLILAGTPALATDAACVEKFKTLVHLSAIYSLTVLI